MASVESVDSCLRVWGRVSETILSIPQWKPANYEQHLTMYSGVRSPLSQKPLCLCFRPLYCVIFLCSKSNDQKISQHKGTEIFVTKEIEGFRHIEGSIIIPLWLFILLELLFQEGHCKCWKLIGMDALVLCSLEHLQPCFKFSSPRCQPSFILIHHIWRLLQIMKNALHTEYYIYTVNIV